MLAQLAGLAGFRRPGEAMQTLSIRLPDDRLQELQAHAGHLQMFPTALARALVLQGLDQLNTEAES